MTTSQGTPQPPQQLQHSKGENPVVDVVDVDDVVDVVDVVVDIRVRREVLEGTWEEMVDLEDEVDFANNGTVKREASEFPDLTPHTDSTRSDVCESEAEIFQPYWAGNSNGKVRAILNNDQFEQAIHQEVCR